MKDFMTYDFPVTDVQASGYVLPGTGTLHHVNRKCHGLAFNLENEKDYVFSDGRCVSVGQNEIVYLPKGSSYDVRTPCRGSCYFVNFDFAGEADFPPFSLRVKNPAPYLALFRSAAALHLNKKRAYLMQEKAALYQILSLMQTEYESRYQPSKTASILAPAVSFIKQNYAKEEISVPDLARMCGISEDYLRKLFRTVFGVSPRRYINQMKLDYAKELIGSGMYGITDAADLSGFGDASYFSREFHKAFGLSPAEYKRESCSKNVENANKY